MRDDKQADRELDFATLVQEDAAREDGRQSEAARTLQRGVTRMLSQENTACLPEISLPNHRRADLMGITQKGELWIIEIKSGLADLQADKKWPEYLPYCDRFFFAIAPDFPVEHYMKRAWKYHEEDHRHNLEKGGSGMLSRSSFQKSNVR